ncbi:Putative sugar isomerase yihS [Gluconacetobacter sp. SXCC-1]|uniref:Sugar isomerase n=1 Tax=Komagataeibacter rhaeticus TaxID=215221 RepID=A0A181C9Z6_9PROT|nr:AGE family epimerase/isomerase [Komagataeibacter rhaeticus]ATU73048.1 sugar isomerase [Komagataeibacter xylinus]EGG77131.1 Putative sugar isomerase yihS [Gluconacetobacter sp. SXCC-1]QIP35207.1 sugar isomerase [Komagataeibacter rhaeticus]QOC47770.1 AGE family epimerase/isomerase [Komagataeibacter rhaeticus]WPP22865.1 AGE family epimerase/isomerase [Komagataeibacter rhaeticus]
MAEPLAGLVLPVSSWLRLAPHRHWLDMQGQRLLDFSKPSRVPHGFAALGDDGRLQPGAVADGTLTARMTHVHAVAMGRGLPGCAPLAAHGVASLRGALEDHDHGGWYLTPAINGKPPEESRKQAYLHAFVALAASSAHVAGVAGGRELLDTALPIWERHFWSEAEGVFRESFAADWSDEEDYRGANANMHSVEACMAVADVTGNGVWRHRALRIAERFIHTYARDAGYCLPEHYSREWGVLKDDHRDRPADALRPYGMTPGHFVEWAHLLLRLEAALLRADGHAPPWLVEDAIELFHSGMNNGWQRDGAPGLLYTIDWARRPVVHNRPHWCQAEAMTAAAALLKRTGHQRYEHWYRTIWDYIDTYMIDRQQGGWIQELDEHNHPSSTIQAGKADLYHAWQATIMPLLPLAPSLATAVTRPGS